MQRLVKGGDIGATALGKQVIALVRSAFAVPETGKGASKKR